MLFPVIKIKDGNHAHVVGTNSHDVLYVDEETGGIQYLNLQCCEGTKKYEGEASMSFIAEEPEDGEIYPRIEMVTIEELIEIAEKTMVQQTEASLRLHASFEKYLKAKELCKEKSKGDTISDTSGMLF